MILTRSDCVPTDETRKYFEEKISTEKAVRIKRERSDLTDEQAWNAIYSILFPSAVLPASPCKLSFLSDADDTDYNQDVNGLDLQKFRSVLDYLQRRATTLISSELRRRGLSQAEDLQQQTHSAISRAIAQASIRPRGPLPAIPTPRDSKIIEAASAPSQVSLVPRHSLHHGRSGIWL